MRPLPRLAVYPRRPQFRRSVAAVLDALAPVLVRRAGSIAERTWAEVARLPRSTLRTVLAWVTEHGLADDLGEHAAPIVESMAATSVGRLVFVRAGRVLRGRFRPPARPALLPAVVPHTPQQRPACGDLQRG